MTVPSVRFRPSGVEVPAGTARCLDVASVNLLTVSQPECSGSGWEWTSPVPPSGFEGLGGAPAAPLVEMVRWPHLDLDAVSARDQIGIFTGIGCDAGSSAFWPAMSGLPELHVAQHVPMRNLSVLENLWAHLGAALVRRPDVVVLSVPKGILNDADTEHLARRVAVLARDTGRAIAIVTDDSRLKSDLSA